MVIVVLKKKNPSFEMVLNFIKNNNLLLAGNKK